MRAMTLLLILVPAVASSNAPPPWSACAGRVAGDACELYPQGEGTCTLQVDCVDPVESTENECLWCAGSPDGSSDGTGCSTGGAAAGLALLAAVLLAWAGARTRRRGL